MSKTVNNSQANTQSTVTAPVIDKSGSNINQQAILEKSLEKLNSDTSSLNLVSLNNVSSSNVAKVNSSGTNVNKSADQSVNSSKVISTKTQESKTKTLQDEEAVRMAEMAKKIDAWVNTRGMKPVNSSSNYKSDIIQFNGGNNSVVLGGQSSGVKKIG